MDVSLNSLSYSLGFPTCYFLYFSFVFFVVFVGYYSHKDNKEHKDVKQKVVGKKIPAFAGTKFYLR